MKNFKELDIKVSYSSVKDNMIKDFYTPILSNSLEYNVVSCYFSLKTLINLSRPLSLFLKNKGKAKFIMSFEMDQKDYKFFKKLPTRITDSIKNEINEKIKSEKGIKIDLANLGYLFLMNKLEIKIALVERGGLFHQKWGIAVDRLGDIIYYSGSINHTEYGMSINSENLSTRKSFNDSESDKELIEDRQKSFEELWNNKREGHIVYKLPEAIKKEIIKFKKHSTWRMNENISYLKQKEEFRYYLENNIDKFDNSSLYFKSWIEPLIYKKQDSRIYFRKISNYEKIKKFIERLEVHCKKVGLKLEVSNDIIDFIKVSDLNISKRRELGALIKNKDKIIMSKFDKFRFFLDQRLKRKLNPQQLWDAFHCVNMRISSNYSVPGTGKTAMILGSFYYLKEHDEVDKLIVIGPKNSRKSWRDEIKKVFHEGNIKFTDVTYFNKKNMRNRFFTEQINDYDVIFINYEALKPLSFQLRNYIKASYYICFDEIHRLKGSDSQRAILAEKFFSKNKYKTSLTGTPNPNGFKDFYSQLKILFTHEYDSFFGYSIKELNSMGSDRKAIENFNNKYQPFFCRTTKKDLDIKPPLKDIILDVPMTKIEQDIYNEIRIQLSRNKLLMYIRMIQLTTIPKALNNTIDKKDVEYMTTDNEDIDEINSFSLLKLSEDVLEKAKSIKHSSKILKAKHEIKKIIDEKRNLIVWSIFKETHKKVLKELQMLNIKAAIINGDVPLDERESIIEDFKSGNFDVLISNPHTLGESVSLHECCHDAMYLEYDFNLAHNLQSRDRIHRLGLDKSKDTRYYYLVSNFINDVSKNKEKNSNFHSNTADQIIYERLDKKRKEMLSIVESDLIDSVKDDNIEEYLELMI